MSDLTSFVYEDGSHFYFDSENYNGAEFQLSIKYEDGDMIKWTWNGKRMTGVLREEGFNLGLFKINEVKALD